MKNAIRVLLAVSLALALGSRAYAQATSNNDYCTFAKRSTAVVAISSATDTQIVPLAAGTSIYVCNYIYDGVVGVGTVYLESATAAACAGTLAQVSGLMTANTSSPAAHLTSSGELGTKIVVPTGDALCVKSTGTIGQDIMVSYVQQ